MKLKPAQSEISQIRFPSIDKLSSHDLRKLREFVENPEGKEITYISDFDDDHTVCINAIINGVKASYWWNNYGVEDHFKQKNIKEVREIVESDLQKIE